jgi:hypothetical protein
MPETLDIKPEELDALLERVRLNQLQEGDYELIKALIETVSYLSSLSDEKAASIKRLLKMLFGSKIVAAYHQSLMNPAAGEPDIKRALDAAIAELRQNYIVWAAKQGKRNHHELEN